MATSTVKLRKLCVRCSFNCSIICPVPGAKSCADNGGTTQTQGSQTIPGNLADRIGRSERFNLKRRKAIISIFCDGFERITAELSYHFLNINPKVNYCKDNPLFKLEIF